MLMTSCGGADGGAGGSGAGANVPVCEPPELDTGAGCIRPGMTPEQCATGFNHDGEYRCVPIVPAEPCPYGSMAAVGEDSCRPVAACGSGKWGDIPTTPQTQHVDGSYQGSDSDGSAERPWVTITDAVGGSVSGGLIAIAAGSYLEDVVISDTAVTLWGLCPEMVEVVGTSTGNAAILIYEGASGSAVRNLSLTGGAEGLIVAGAVDVTVHQLWVHDTNGWGLSFLSSFGPTAVAITDSLVEQCHQLGLLVDGSQITIERSVIRATLPALGSGRDGYGIAAQVGCTAQGCDTSLRSEVTIRGSVFEQNHAMGVFLAGSDMLIEGSVIRLTQPEVVSQMSGRGVSIQPTCDAQGICDPQSRANLTLRSSFVHQNHDVGLFVGGSDALVESTVIAGTLPRAAGLVTGRGLSALMACTLEAGCDPTIRSTLVLQSSVVEQNHDAGLFVAGSDLTVHDTVVRDTIARPDGYFGDGIAILSELSLSTASVSETLVDACARAGVASFGSSITIQKTAIRCAAFALEGENSEQHSYHFEDLGGNRCGCPEANDSCSVVSSGLAPPDPMP